MAGSGVATDPSCLTAFGKVNTKKADFAIFEINATKTLVLPTATFPDEKSDEDLKAFAADEAEKKREVNFATRVLPKFKAALIAKGKSPCYAVLDFHYIAEERAQFKLIFVFWCPENAGVRDKMVAASTYQAFSAKLGVACKLQVQDASDLDLAALVAKATAK